MIMLEDWLLKEVDRLCVISGKDRVDVLDYVVGCYRLLDDSCITTQYEHELFVMSANNLIVDFLRDYSLFDIDSSFLLKNYRLDFNDSYWSNIF